MDDSEEGDVLYSSALGPAMASTYTSYNPRPGVTRGRRKRFSIHRLSTDTSNSLPEYTKSPPPKSKPVVVEELPPHYSSEDDADADDEEKAIASSSSHQQRKARTQQRRPRRRHRSYSPQDPFLDALLDRSIRALELSNSLLQSSIVAHPPRTSTATADQMIDQSLDHHTHLMTQRIAGSTHVQAGWMTEMDKVLKGVEELFDEGEPVPPARPRPRLQVADGGPHLRRETSQREQTSRPPRALTQYVSIESSWGDTLDATADESSILMPSTLGLRAAAHISDFRPTTSETSDGEPLPNRPYHKHTQHAASVSDFRSAVGAGSSSRNHSLPPILTQYPSAPTTPAYNLLSSIVSREASTPSSSRSSSRPDSWRYSQGSRFSVEQAVLEEDEPAPVPVPAPPTPPHRTIRSLSISSELPPEPSSSRPIRFAEPPRRANSLQISSSAPAHQSHFRTVASLRKILDSSPARPDSPHIDIKGKGKAKATDPPRILRTMPSLRLISPPNASTATSTATASISHLLALSNSPADRSISLPPTPRMSSLKQGPLSMPGTPTESGRSTPRNVSFAVEPIKYSIERGPNLNGRSVKDARKSKRKGSNSPPEGNSWWQWLAATPASGGHAPPSRTSDERSTRPGYGRSMDEWMM